MNLNIGFDSFDDQGEETYFDTFSRSDAEIKQRYEWMEGRCRIALVHDLTKKVSNWGRGLDIIYNDTPKRRAVDMWTVKKAQPYFKKFDCFDANGMTGDVFSGADCVGGKVIKLHNPNIPNEKLYYIDNAGSNGRKKNRNFAYHYEAIIPEDKERKIKSMSISSRIYIWLEKRDNERMIIHIRPDYMDNWRGSYFFGGKRNPYWMEIFAMGDGFKDHMENTVDENAPEKLDYAVLNKVTESEGKIKWMPDAEEIGAFVDAIMKVWSPYLMRHACADYIKESFDDEIGGDGTYFDTFSRADTDMKIKMETMHRNIRNKFRDEMTERTRWYAEGLNILYDKNMFNWDEMRFDESLPWSPQGHYHGGKFSNKWWEMRAAFEKFDPTDGMTLYKKFVPEYRTYQVKEAGAGQFNNPGVADAEFGKNDGKGRWDFTITMSDLLGDGAVQGNPILGSFRLALKLRKCGNRSVKLDLWHGWGNRYWGQAIIQYTPSEDGKRLLSYTSDLNVGNISAAFDINDDLPTNYTGFELVRRNDDGIWEVNEEDIDKLAGVLEEYFFKALDNVLSWVPFVKLDKPVTEELIQLDINPDKEETYFDTFSKDNTEYNEWMGAALDSAKKYISIWKWWDWYKNEPKDYSQHNYDNILCDADFIGYAKYVFSYCFWQGWNKEDLEDAKIVSDGQMGMSRWSNGQFIWSAVRDETIFFIGRLYMESVSKEERDRLYYYTNSKIIDTAKKIITLIMEKFRQFNVDGTQLKDAEAKGLNESRMEMMNLFDTEDFDDKENNDGNYFDTFNQEQTRFRDEWLEWYDKHNGAIGIIKNDPGFSNAQWNVGGWPYDDEPSVVIKAQFKRSALKYVLGHRDPDHYLRPQHTYNKDICDDDIINISKIFFSFLCWLCMRADATKLRSDPASHYPDCWYTLPSLLGNHANGCLEAIQGMLHGICKDLSSKKADGYITTYNWQKEAYVYYYAQYATAFIPFIIYNIYAYESKMAYKNIKTYKLDKEEHGEDKYYWNSLIDNFGDPRYGDSDDNMSDIYKAVWNIVREHFDKFMEYVNDRCMDKENVENKDHNKRIIIYK